VEKIVQDAIDHATFLCSRYYSVAPEVYISSMNNTPTTFQYIPSHLYYILFELLKNSMRAVVETHPDSPPKICVAIGKGNQDLTIKISDQGGGIPLRAIPLLFSYLYTTASLPTNNKGSCPLAGYGCGLPISRLYARYFGGDLRLMPMEGFGTDAYVFLKIASSEALETISLKTPIPES